MLHTASMATRTSGLATSVVPIRPDVTVAQQISLLPLQIDAELPSQFSTADLRTVVRAIDGHFYAMKSQDEHFMLPASEFLCYRLASACQIAVPFSTVLVDARGRHFFGSRFEGATTQITAAGPTVGLQMYKESAKQVSAALAFDLFIGNEDRHRDNFIFRKNHQGQWAPLAIDYSRALFVRGFPNDNFPLPAGCNTRLTITQMKAADIWDGPHAIFSVGNLQQIAAEHVSRWCDEMPEVWLSASARSELLTWWRSPAFGVRLNALYGML